VSPCITPSIRPASVAGRLALGPGRRTRQSRQQRFGLAVLVGDHVLRPPANQVDRAVGSDSVDPGAERGPCLESPQLGVCPQEGLLDHVLGVRLAARDAIRHAEDGTAVPLDERAESLAISGFRLGKDESVAVHGHVLTG
jgi:hypothetical protein